MFTINDAGMWVAGKLGVPPTIGENLIATAIQEIGGDGEEHRIDPQRLTNEQFQQLTTMVVKHHREGSIGSIQLEAVLTECEKVARAERALNDAIKNRDRAILRAHAHGVRKTDLVKATNLSRTGLDQALARASKKEDK